MMRTAVHNARAKLRALEGFVARSVQHLTGDRNAFQLSDVKGDGTVFVRFRSTDKVSSINLAETFRDALNGLSIRFEQTDDTKFRASLDAFVPYTASGPKEST
jgi:hypothetical protein